MKISIQIVSLAVMICISYSCKKHTKYHIKFSPDLYVPEFFATNCNELFNQPLILVNLDSFRFNSIRFNKHPIHQYCKDNLKLNEFFTKDQDLEFPFYIGRVINTHNIPLELFTFHYSKLVVGYFSLKNKDGYLIFKGYKSWLEYPPTVLEPYFSKNYLLLWEETDEAYDVVDHSKSKTIEVKFCVLKIMADRSIILLSQKEGSDLLKNNFFPNLPPSDFFSFSK